MNDLSTDLQLFLDELTQFGSQEERKLDLLSAKTQYFSYIGEVFEDDRQFEIRMSGFLDWYLFDRRQPGLGLSPVQECYLESIRARNAARARGFRGLTETLHSLFSVSKVSAGGVLVTDLISKLPFEVSERRAMKGIEEGDLLETRLIPFGGSLFFSQSLCVHPRVAAPLVLAESRRRSLESGEERQKFIWECAKMSLKVDRYRQISVEKIYDFRNRVI